MFYFENLGHFGRAAQFILPSISLNWSHILTMIFHCGSVFMFFIVSFELHDFVWMQVSVLI